MNLLSAINPDSARSVALAWIETAGVVLGSILATLTVVLPKIAALKTQIQTLFNLHGQNSHAITTLALHTPVPPPAAVEAPPVSTLAPQ